MTTPNHQPGRAERIVATFADTDSARRAALSLEQIGIDNTRVTMDAIPTAGPRVADRQEDARTVERPRRQAVQGMVVGGVIGAALGASVGVVVDAIPLVAAIGLFAIPGATLGGMYGVFTRLPANPEVAEADAAAGGGTVVLAVDLTALEDADRQAVTDRLRGASPIELSER
jgi:hypothetical protein